MKTERVQRVKGVVDVLPAEYEINMQVQQQLLHYFESFGYQEISTPILEHSDLYLRKSGEDIVSRMYDFYFKHRRLCLRPELTASIVRSYIENLQNSVALPIRLSSSGAVFRYEKPQKTRYRQFTQVGIELIGAPGEMADAEVIRVACGGLDAIHMKNYKVVLGNVGILTHFLQQLGIQGQMYSFLLHNLETLRKRGLDYIVAEIQKLYPTFVFSAVKDADVSSDEITGSNKRLIDILKTMNEDDARNAVYDFLQSLNVTIDSNREKDDIVDGLLSKIRRESQLPKLNQALSFMQTLSELVGSPDEILAAARDLLIAYDVDLQALDSLSLTLDLLRAYGLGDDKIELDLGLSRGLQYYTGMVFEIHHDSLGENAQICGGGRYDDLVAVLGGDNVAAIGFSYGLERILLALQTENKAHPSQSLGAVVYVFALNQDEYDYAIQIAENLRVNGLSVELGLRDRNIRNNLLYADKKGFRFVLTVGPDEKSDKAVTVRAMNEREEQRISYDELVSKITNMSVVYADSK